MFYESFDATGLKLKNQDSMKKTKHDETCWNTKKGN